MGERQLRESPVRLLLQVSLGAIWVYDGLVTKLLAPAPHLPSLVVAWVSPGSAELVLRGIGAVELAAGLLLVQGWRLRATALAHCAVLTAITVGLAALQPDSLLTPLGAIPQNIPLIAAGIGLLLLTGERAGPGSGPEAIVPLLLRASLACMWGYEGILLWWGAPSPAAVEMLVRTGVVASGRIPALLGFLSGVQIALGLTLLLGCWVRGLAVLQVGLLTALAAVVGWTSPAYVQGTLGELAEDLGLIGCALVLYWTGAGAYSLDAWLAGNPVWRRWTLLGFLEWNLLRTLGMGEMYRLQQEAARDSLIEETLHALRLEGSHLEADMRTLIRRHGGRPSRGAGPIRVLFWVAGALTVVLGAWATLRLDLWLKTRGLRWYTRAADLLPPDEGITYRVLQSMQDREATQVRAIRETLRTRWGNRKPRR